MKLLVTHMYDSPCGTLLIASFGNAICMCDWISAARHPMSLAMIQRSLGAHLRTGSSTATESAVRQLDEYFAGIRKTFNLNLMPTGSEFQQEVWNSISQISYGSTLSYSALACSIGRPKACRAAASACASNLISILIPCHRAIASSGNLHHYRGGSDAKRYLLSLEASNVRL